MARSILDITIKLAKQGNADTETVKGLTKLKTGIGEVMTVAGAFAGVMLAVSSALKFSVSAAMEAERFDAKLASVLRSTAGAAGMSKQALDDLATTKSRMTGIDDELIKNQEAVMLTFTSIGKQVFPEAMQAALDMNAVMGGDLQMSVVQLGKALNVTAGDTTSASLGMSAMRKSGVSFTDEQKQMAMQMVETGDIMGYQRLILGELNREFGGAAVAMGSSAAGSSEKLKNAFGNLGEAIGARLLPALTKNNNVLADIVNTMADGVEAANIYAAAEDVVADSLDRVVHAQAAANELLRWTQYGQAWENQLASGTAELRLQEEQIDAIMQKNQGMMGLIGQIQSENDKYTQSLDELNAKFADGKYVQDLYTQSKSELLAQARAGSITWEEYSAQVAGLNSDYKDGTLAAQEQAVAMEELAAQHEDASRRIAYSLLQQKAAADGLTNAEFQGLLSIGKMWGMIDEKTAESAILMDKQMSQIAAAIEDPLGNTIDLNQSMYHLLQKSGSIVDFTVNILTIGSLPSRGAFSGQGAGYLNNAGVDAEFYAEGGQLGNGFAIVGEQGYELVTPSGYVIPHEISRALMSSGISPEFSYRIGGFLGEEEDRGGGLHFAPWSYTQPQPRPSSSLSSASSSVLTAEITQASVNVAAGTAAMAAETSSDAVKTATMVQQQAAVEASRTQSVIEQGNAAMLTAQQETNRILRDQSKNMTRSLVAAMQQAAP